MAPTAAPPEPTVYVVDADAGVRDSLHSLLTLHGFRVESYASARAFLDGISPNPNACLVTEVHLSDMSGIELLERLRREGRDLPVVFIAERGDVPTAVQAIRSGGVDFLEKPFLGTVLLQRMRELLATGARQAATDRP